MSPNLLLVIVVGVLFAAGVTLLLERTVVGIDEPPSGKVYQLWVITGTNVVPHELGHVFGCASPLARPAGGSYEWFSPSR